MPFLTDKPAFAVHIQDNVMDQISMDGESIDAMKLMQLYAGLLVETVLLFDEPDEGLVCSFERLRNDLGVEPRGGGLGPKALPPAYLIDQETEKGRKIARDLFEEWLDCAHEFHDLLLYCVQYSIKTIEASGQRSSDLLRLFIELSNRCLAYEIAAQELCDIVIEKKIGEEGWTLTDSVSALSAVSGRYLGLSRNACEIFEGPALPESLDQVAYVMTQEAIRLGIPAGTDWRFGLAANDCPVSAPFDLIMSLWPVCQEFFGVMSLNNILDQATATAKAAGRMLAVAAGGEMPEIQPIVAKPLAMSAMTDTYKTVCEREELVIS